MTDEVKITANYALAKMLESGFDQAQVSVTTSEQDELNIMHNEPSLLRSNEDYALNLTGIIDGRKAVVALTDLSRGTIDDNIDALIERARLAPQDEANAVSTDQKIHFEQGPRRVDHNLLAQKVEELIAYRQDQTPKMRIEEGSASHRVSRECLLTSGGSELSCHVGSYELAVFGLATDGANSSSFNYTGGRTNDLDNGHVSEFFGIGEMMIETEQQIETRSINGNFVGTIILSPSAVSSLLSWLLGNLSDLSLLADTSPYKTRIDQQIADSQLSVRSNFEGPGQAPYSADGFVAEPLTVVEGGKLNCLLPSLYGSLKTGIKHIPSSSGWTIDAGNTPKLQLVKEIEKGAMVNRLSMGSPGPSGDFSGVIKNSFIIENGQIGHALSETMIAGNMADMLQDIIAVSSERRDFGGQHFPWISIANLNFS